MTRLQNHSTEPYAKAFLASSFLMVTAFLLLLLRLFHIQVWKGEDFRNLSENNRIRLMEIHAPRGKILDANHENLVDNRPCFDVSAIPEEIQDYESLERILKELSPLPPETLEEKLINLKHAIPFRSHALWNDATWETMAYLEANRLRIPGVVLQVNQARDYLVGDQFAHVIGYMGEISRVELKKHRKQDYRIGDRIGKVGIEKTWEKVLRGTKGGEQVEVDARGRQIRLLKRKTPIPGKNLLLSLDKRLQEVARKAFGSQSGVALAADPRDGSILCYINLPSYDPNSFVGGIGVSDWERLRTDPLHPLTNRAIQGIYPPGSIFKIVVAIAALEEGAVTPEEKIFCSGKYRLGRHSFRCWKRHGHGWVDLHQALVESCDIYFYQIGQRLGIRKIKTYAEKFGLGQKTRIQLGGEHAGLVPSPEWKKKRFNTPWYEGETLLVSIGQGALLTTPIQVLMMISTLANGGDLWKPRLVDRVVYPDGKLFLENPPQRRASVDTSSRTVAILQKALRDVVHSRKGTGQRTKLSRVEVAGKTGTAQVVRQEEQIKSEEQIPWEHRDHAWFACYAPVYAPEIAVVVLVEHGGHGGESAAPIAKIILEEYFRIRESESPS